MSDEPLAWETLERRVAYECPGFEIVREDARLPNGTVTDFDYLSEGESVVVLPLTPGGDVVVVEEWRQAVERVNRALPAGGLEPSDGDVDAAAHRELTEETGYEADAVERLTSVEPANGFADDTTSKTVMVLEVHFPICSPSAGTAARSCASRTSPCRRSGTGVRTATRGARRTRTGRSVSPSARSRA